MAIEHQREIRKSLNSRAVAFCPALVDIVGSINAALFLAQLLYWHSLGVRKDGYIFKTIAQTHEETRLTRAMQDKVVNDLQELGIIDYKLAGVPAKRHFLLNLDELYHQVSMHEDFTPSKEKAARYLARNKQTITETTQENTIENNPHKTISINELFSRNY